MTPKKLILIFSGFNPSPTSLMYSYFGCELPVCSMQFCIVCQSKINSVRLLCNEHFDSLNAVDNVVVVNEADRSCCM